MDKFNRETLFEMENDGYDEMREDMNSVLRSKISEGQSNITQEKYLIISIKAETSSWQTVPSPVWIGGNFFQNQGNQ